MKSFGSGDPRITLNFCLLLCFCLLIYTGFLFYVQTLTLTLHLDRPVQIVLMMSFFTGSHVAIGFAKFFRYNRFVFSSNSYQVPA
jgi:hypothetical protein